MADNLMSDGVISLDERPAIRAVDNINTKLDGHEQKTKTVMDRTGKLWEVMGDVVVRTSDKSKNALDRLLTSMQRQADMAGKSGVDKMIAQRDQLIARWSKEQAAVDAINRSYEKLIATERKAEQERAAAQAEMERKASAQTVSGWIQDPFGKLKESASEFLTAIGPVGGAVLGTAAAIVALTAAGFEAAKSLAEYGLQIRNVELRTGLTSKEVGQFGFAARMAGQDVSIFERMMKGLSQAADEHSKEGEKARATLRGMGVDLRTAAGEMKPTSQALLEISAGLAKLPEGVQRDAAAMDLFKKIGVEAIPVISGLADNVKRAKELGLGATEEDLKRWEEYHRNVTEAEVLWERFTRKIKEPLAAVITFLFKDRQGNEYSIEDLQKRGVNLGKWAPRTAQGDRAAARAAGFSNPERDQWEANIQRDAILGYVGKVEERNRADAAVRSFEASQGLAGQLKKAEDALAGMTKPTVGVSSLKDVQDYQAAERQVESLKKQIEGAKKASEELTGWRRQAADFEKKGDEAELSAIGKIYYQRDQLIAQGQKLKATEAEIAAIRKAADEQAGAVSKKDWAAFEDYDQKRRQEQNHRLALMMLPSKGQLKDWQEGFEAQDKIADINMQSRRDTLNRQAGNAQKLVSLSGLTGMDAITAAYQIRVNLAKELAAVEGERIAREENGWQQQIDIAKAQKDLQKEMDEAHEEALLKQLELQKQQLDGLKKESEGLWHTLLTNPRSFPKQLGSTVHEAVIKPVAEGMAGMTANVLKPIIYGADGNGGIAGFFKGMFGGGSKQDPMKVATDMNTAVTAQNSAAIATLTAILAGAMGMAAPAVASPAGIGGISLPSISMPAPSVSMPSISIGGGGGSVSPGGWGGWGYSPMSGGYSPASEGGPSVEQLANLPMSHNAGFNPLVLAGLGGGKSGGGFSLSNIKGSLANLKGAVINQKMWDATGTSFGAYAGSVLTSPAATTAGMMLATSGLMGSHRGTWGGVAMDTVGGALVGAGIGAQFGGPMGALIGAGIGTVAGFAAGSLEKLFGVESPENEAKRLVKQLYGVNIDTSMAKQIAGIAQSKYAGHISVAVRDPDVRKMLELYAQGTGQKMPLSATTPRGGSLVEQGGNLYQQASYQYGQAYTFQSSLPVLGGLSGGTYGSPGGPNTAGGTGSSFTININGREITPEFVADSSAAAQGAGYGRTQQAANFNVPGLMTGT